MDISNNEELVEIVSETLLWEIVSEHVTTDVERIKEELRKIGNRDQNKVERLTTAEVLQSDEFIITGYEERGGKLVVGFDMPAIVITQSDDKKVGFRVTTSCIGTVEIPDISSYDWSALDFEDMDRLTLLSYSHLTDKLNYSYEYTEADTIMM